VRVAAALVVSTALLVASPGSGQAGDPQLGEVQFQRHCGACHVIDRTLNVFGPHLVDVYGREAGSVPNFRYSFEMRVSGIVWDEETLDALIAHPQGYIPGTIMYSRGIRDEETRANIIAFLKQRSGVE
jgi:cytochrome c